MGRSWHAAAHGRTAGLVALVAAAALAAPVLWDSGDLVLRSLVVGGTAALAVSALRRRLRPVPPDEVYAAALGEASAMRVHLLHARVAAVHDGRMPSLVTVTWRGARTTLLDADGRQLAELERNGLTTAYTLSIPVWDTSLVDVLARDTGLGQVSVYGTTDLAAHPDGNLRDHGLYLDQYDVAFPSWSGSLPARAELTPWEA